MSIILILAAILIPKLMSARAAALESAGVGAVKNLNTTLAMYDTKYGSYPASLSALGGTCSATVPPTPTAACLLDNTIATTLGGATPVQGDYTFTYQQNNAGAGFQINADPIAGSSATRHLFSNDGLVIHSNFTAPATVNDPAI